MVLSVIKEFKGGIEDDIWQVIDLYLLKPHMILLETADENFLNKHHQTQTLIISGQFDVKQTWAWVKSREEKREKSFDFTVKGSEESEDSWLTALKF